VVRLIPQLIEFASRQYGDSPFVLRQTSSGWRGHGFRAAAAAVHAFAALLEREGVRPGDRVGIQSENRPEWGLAYLAILEVGAVAVPLDAQLQEAEVGEILAASSATHVIVSARQHPLLVKVRDGRLHALRMIGLDAIAGLPSWDEAQQRFAGAAALRARSAPDDLAVLIFTSGTTGQPKGVMLSHANLLYNVESVARAFHFGPADRCLSVLPLHHTFEATAGFLTPLRVGASIAYARSLKSNELREDLQTAGATILLGVPLLYDKLLQAIHRAMGERALFTRLMVKSMLGTVRLARWTIGARIGSGLFRALRERSGMGRVRLFVSGAAGLPPEVFWGLTDLGWTVLEGYGLTECSPVVAANRPERTQPGSVGWPLPGVEVRIDSPDAEGNGEIAVCGPNIMLGYYGNPGATAEVLRDGWFYTGDLGRQATDGRLRITGRLKNMIATAAGKKIYPEEVETALAGSPYIHEIVVTGDPRDDGREEVHAHIVPNREALEALAATQGRTCDDAFILETLKREVETRGQALAPYKRVRRVIVRSEEFPKTTTGKIRRHNLAADAATARRFGAVA
jgi:long-chain acyl-CoA synthetase